MGNQIYGLSNAYSEFRISVKTSDRFGAGTDSGVYVILHDKLGHKSETHKLDKFFRNDFERGKTDSFKIKTIFLEEIADIEIWRDGFGVAGAWHFEFVSVEDVKTGVKKIFPFHRWLEEEKHYFIEAYDSTLPQKSKFKVQRIKEMHDRRVVYQYTEAYPNLPLQVQVLHEDDRFSDQYAWNFGMQKLSLLSQKLWTGWFKVDKKSHFKSFDEILKMFDNFKDMQVPRNAENWKEDWYFGHSAMNNCNPKVIQLCSEIPEKFSVCAETLKPLLEGKTIKEVIEAKKLFLMDLTVLDGVSATPGMIVPSPYCLLYLNNDNILLPVAIQLFKEPGTSNPVFYPSDDKNLWILAKMWYNLADFSHHQAVAHLGATHLLMEGICVSVNRSMSPSHPIYKLLAPHFLFLLAINTRALKTLVCPGGWVENGLGIGRIGLFEVVGKVFCNYDLLGKGDLMADLKNRGLDDETVLPDYYYRNDAVLLYKIIKKYVQDMITIFYPTEQDIVDDKEIQYWRQELVSPRPQKLGLTGVPGKDDKFTSHDHLVSLLTYIVFTCSVEHAAVNFSQYESTAFPAAYPPKLLGKPPMAKEAKTEEDLLAPLADKETMMNQLVVSSLLSQRGTKSLGDFEVVYHYRPDVLDVVKRFKAELKEAADIIAERDARRKISYDILNPREIPNSISV